MDTLTPSSAPAGTPKHRRRFHGGRLLVIGVPQFWFVVFLLVPFLILLKISLSVSNELGVGFEPLVAFKEEALRIQLHFGAYLALLRDDLYLLTYLSSIGYALFTTFLCLVIGYPFAYFLARSNPSVRPALLMLVMLPFWTSFLIRIYAWKNLLDINGLVNQFLLWTGIIDAPLRMMFTTFSFMIGMVYGYIPFMILPLYATLVKLDGRLLEAAADLGATPLKTFWLVTVPLSRAGIVAGSLLVFIPAVGEYVIPELLAGPSVLNIGRVMWNEFFLNLDWQRAAAVTIVMVLLILVPIAIFNRYQTKVMEAAS
ncbi:ABC transporter permease subunit [Extensimonas vulgaris]|jgi:putrescine transport system permease protein|uniref:Putrescine transport system permease protein n=1 Tax=Extensimonas vulgaris TaxID=1031594 RepID=A0A369AGA5_9BURK|nr:ABC transporter permease subunit [Extensimonas vulgaris]RCX07316.1 putrescine transport system permease protein [Extensimonas vulgaris]TWI34713.1 putrescine transport system permease protein [Extensimonas vulgaris]TXD12788.1 ABC transporter permease subunit [Extensimonas vulgaris]